MQDPRRKLFPQGDTGGLWEGSEGQGRQTPPWWGYVWGRCVWMMGFYEGNVALSRTFSSHYESQINTNYSLYNKVSPINWDMKPRNTKDILPNSGLCGRRSRGRQAVPLSFWCPSACTASETTLKEWMHLLAQKWRCFAFIRPLLYDLKTCEVCKFIKDASVVIVTSSPHRRISCPNCILCVCVCIFFPLNKGQEAVGRDPDGQWT